MGPARQPGDIFENTGDVLLLIALSLAAVITTGAWLTGQLAALFSHGDWPPVSIWQALTAAWQLPADIGDPKMAWPATVRPELPGPLGFLAAGIVASLAVIAIMLVLGGWALAHRPQRGLASRAEIKATLSEKAVIARGHVVRPSLRRRPR
jgi:type IV secretion system protein VirD4